MLRKNRRWRKNCRWIWSKKALLKALDISIRSLCLFSFSSFRLASHTSLSFGFCAKAAFTSSSRVLSSSFDCLTIDGIKSLFHALDDGLFLFLLVLSSLSSSLSASSNSSKSLFEDRFFFSGFY